MKILKRILLTAVLIFSISAPCLAAPKGWEIPRTERTDTHQVAADSDIEIKTARGIIIVNTSHQLPIKVFTILGRLVSSETLQPGTSQFTVPAHGIYIIKAGDITCKVAL